MSHEIRRLFGPFNRPHYTNNVQNGHRISHETPPPDAEAQQQLHFYMDAYDAYFMKQGTAYRVRNPDAKDGLQVAEQHFHDWMVRRRAARNLGPCPNWALEPLPGFRRVQLLPVPAAPPPPPSGRYGGNPVAARVVTNVHLPPASPRAPRPFPRLPTPPPRADNSVAAAALGSRLRPIEVYETNDEGMRTPQKRKFLGIVDISDDEEEDRRPRKRQRFSEILDLTI
ncbi:hypothetical protein C8R47DRAFT_1254570 [Mycena vitilis]|nr:hypothetical protein C8R47DRAFT_1254570 [Mycena vitilis]